MKRKLTTILFADAQGYSAMMAVDEAGTLERLNRYRGIMAALFARHDGRQVNTWGDAIIAEFSSVVEAVRCAVEIQDALSTENRALPRGSQMWFRLGVNLGDVMIDGDDLYGDGVNVAQRLESLAEPGGVMVSGTVHSLSHKQLALAFDFAGDQPITGNQDRVPTYSVRMAVPNVGGAGDTVQLQPPLPAEGSTLARIAWRMEAAWHWLQGQPGRVRWAAGAIAFFAAVNLLFDGIANPWFIFPSAPFALYIYLRVRRERRDRIELG